MRIIEGIAENLWDILQMDLAHIRHKATQKKDLADGILTEKHDTVRIELK